MNDDVILVFPGGGQEGSVTALCVFPRSFQRGKHGCIAWRSAVVSGECTPASCRASHSSHNASTPYLTEYRQNPTGTFTPGPHCAVSKRATRHLERPVCWAGTTLPVARRGSPSSIFGTFEGSRSSRRALCPKNAGALRAQTTGPCVRRAASLGRSTCGIRRQAHC